jgi:hypothetical protein
MQEVSSATGLPANLAEKMTPENWEKSGKYPENHPLKFNLLHIFNKLTIF